MCRVCFVPMPSHFPLFDKGDHPFDPAGVLCSLHRFLSSFFFPFKDLLMYLLQLVQALKYENFDDIKNGLEPTKKDCQGPMSESMATSGMNAPKIDR